MDNALTSKIRDILSKQNDLTIATLREDGFPQATTVSYASDGLDIYFGCWNRSQMAKNIARDNKISLALNAPYADWNGIRGISLGGMAVPVTAPAGIAKIDALFLKKFPNVAQFSADIRDQMVYFRIVPKVISVLDYTKGFGHTDLVEM
jgi:Pyridoxamine 5'-phosphate oxidase